MEDLEDTQPDNMISNLPLLFANGYPTSLEKITETQLENFIPFMVQCSLGHINSQVQVDTVVPEWWPKDIPYVIPLKKPKALQDCWLDRLKEIVRICYQVHKSGFLLRFCTDMASYEHASLRFVNNYNSTTSLFERRSNKLLVTFRNENMSYDQPQRSRKYLLPSRSKSQNEFGSQQHMVESAPFDIYLCDNCDAELYSLEALLEHEKTCLLDDVIICDSPEPEDEPTTTNDPHLSLSPTENEEQRKAFLLNFSLQSNRIEGNPISLPSTSTADKTTKDANEKPGDDIIGLDKLKSLPRRNRAAFNSLSRCPTVPLSSPAGQLLIKLSKTQMTPEYLRERLDRVERFCQATILAKGNNRPKYLEKKYTTSTPNVTYKKPQEYSTHIYNFPSRQYSWQQNRADNIRYLNYLLAKRCRPVSVRLKKINENDIKLKRHPSTNLNIKLTRDLSGSKNWHITKKRPRPSSQPPIIVDTIDLCSDDDDVSDISQMQSENVEVEVDIGDRENGVDDLAADVQMNEKQLMVDQNSFHIKDIFRRFKPEITLTPISKSGSVRNMSANQGNETSPSTNPNPSPLAISKNRFEGNFLFSPTTSSATVAALQQLQQQPTPTKPLQPSAFLFSNYTTNATPIALNACSSPNNNEITSVFDSSSGFQQNQENLKSTLKLNNSTTEDNWYPHNSNISVNNNNLNRRSDRSPRAMPIMQFNSPNRIVSIDLTS